MRLEVQGLFKAVLLSEEIVAAFPQLVEERDGQRHALFALSYLDSMLRFSTELRLDEAALLAVIAAHDPRRDSRAETRRRRFAVLRQSIEAKLLNLGFVAEEIGFLDEFLEERAVTARASGQTGENRG